MMIFGSISVFMVLAAAVFVLWPLLKGQSSECAGTPDADQERESMVLDLFNQQRRSLKEQYDTGELDDDQYQQLLKELEMSLLEDSSNQTSVSRSTREYRWVLVAAALLLPVVALLFYWQRGSMDDVRVLELRQQYFQQGSDTAPQLLQELIASLNSSLEKRPENVANRYLLARSYMEQGAFVEAVRHYTLLLQQHDDAPANILGELAQAVFLASGSRITPEVDGLVERALALDANEVTSLGLAGISAYEGARYEAAIDFWGRALQQMDPAGLSAQSLQAGIERARQELGDFTGDSDRGVAEPAAQAGIEVRVALGDAVVAAPEETVFVYARAWQGAKMPLAITRLQVKDLPALVQLDESMAMAPGMTIRSFPELELVARISSSGQPMAQPGDWQAATGPVVLEQLDGAIELTIERQLP